jgi:hypothetical protein
VFFGLLLPIAQFVFAIAVAIACRANVAVSAACTLITNPLTFAPVYWLAYRLGSFLVGEPQARARESADQLEASAQAVAQAQGWLEAIHFWLQTAALPLATGLVVLAAGGAALAYAAVWLLWKKAA